MLAGRGHRVGDLVAAGGDAVDVVLALLADRVDELVAGRGKAAGDLDGLVLERTGDVLAGFVDRSGERFGNRLDLFRQVGMGTQDSVAQKVRIADDRLALALELLENGAHALLVLVVGGFQLGDLVVDADLQFAGARKGALDAIAHGVDLAADRLADGGDGFDGRGFGFGQAQGDLGQGASGELHVLRAPDHEPDGEEEEYRNGDGRVDGDHPRLRAHDAGVGDLEQARAIQAEADHDTDECPHRGEQPGNHERGRRGAALQPVQKGFEAGTVVVGRRDRADRPSSSDSDRARSLSTSSSSCASDLPERLALPAFLPDLVADRDDASSVDASCAPAAVSTPFASSSRSSAFSTAERVESVVVLGWFAIWIASYPYSTLSECLFSGAPQILMAGGAGPHRSGCPGLPVAPVFQSFRSGRSGRTSRDLTFGHARVDIANRGRDCTLRKGRW